MVVFTMLETGPCPIEACLAIGRQREECLAPALVT